MRSIRIDDIEKMATAEAVVIGFTGENAVTQIAFDVSAWLREYPDGQLSLIFARDDGTAYLCSLSVEDALATWTITGNEVLQEGRATATLMLEDGEKIMKSPALRLKTRRSYSPNAATADFIAGNEAGIPNGGAAGQMLVKASGSDYDTEWCDVPQYDEDNYDPNAVSYNAQTPTAAQQAQARDNIDVLSVLTGAGDPTEQTAGQIGQRYLNTADGTSFVCTAAADSAYTWNSIGAGDVGGGTGGGVNVLTNWDLRNPVNQRFITSGTAVSTAGYFLDMWKLVSGSVTWTQGAGLLTAAGTTFLQYMETGYTALAGKGYTFSVLLSDGSVKSVSGSFPASVSEATVYTEIALTDVGTVQLGFEYRSDGTLICDATQHYVPYVQLAASGAVTVAAAKLETGAASTLQADPPMNFANEIQKCYRYYLYIPKPKFNSISTSWPGFTADFPVPMRIAPSSNYAVNTAISYYHGSLRTTTIGAIQITATGLVNMSVSPVIVASAQSAFETPAWLSAEL